MNTGLRQFLSFERKQNKILCSTVSLFHVTSSQDLTWIMWSLIFSSILIHKILEGKKFVFMCISLLMVSASHGWCEAGCGVTPLVNPKDVCYWSCTLAACWAPAHEFSGFLFWFPPHLYCATKTQSAEEQRSSGLLLRKRACMDVSTRAMLNRSWND